MHSFSPLTIQRSMVRVALAFAHVFAWIFIFEYWIIVSGGDEVAALVHTLYTYALTHVTTILVTPMSARILGNSFKRSLVYGTIANAVAFALLASVLGGYWGIFNGVALALFAICFGFYRGTYWIPYTSDHRLEKPERDHLTHELVLALLPAVAGLLLGLHLAYPSTILWSAAVILVLSLIPLSFYRDHYERYVWGYKETFSHLISRKNHRLFVRTAFIGIENMALLLLWPLTMLVIVGSHALFGIVLSTTMLVVLVFRIPRASTYITHTHHIDGERYVDEYTALREIAEATGRIALCMIVALSALVTSFTLALFVGFAVAGLAAATRKVHSRRL